MERLSALDAEFLHLEHDSAHMHFAGVSIFEGPPPTRRELIDLLAGKIHQSPRYRQRVQSVPFEIGRPVWVDHPLFDLDHHVRETTLPVPGDVSSLDELMGRLMSQPLEMHRPPWEVWLVDGFPNGEWGLIPKVHHCMVDGIAGVELLSMLLDADREVVIVEPEPWEPEPAPSAWRLMLDAWSGVAHDVADTVSHLPENLRHPVEAARTVGRVTEGVFDMMVHLAPTPHVSIGGPVGPERAWAGSSVPMSDIADIREVFGGTINDVALAATAAGYRQLLLSRGEDPDLAVVRSLVPVSVRGDEDQFIPDNRLTALLCELPVGVADPVERLHAVHEEMEELKGCHVAEAGEAITHAADLAPSAFMTAATSLALRVLRTRAQRSVNTVTTNVPGPSFPLFCLGREMVTVRPFVPITHGMRLGTAILSYNGHLTFGITGDADTMGEDVGLVAKAIGEGVGELAVRARAMKNGEQWRAVPDGFNSRSATVVQPVRTS